MEPRLCESHAGGGAEFPSKDAVRLVSPGAWMVLFQTLSLFKGFLSFIFNYTCVCVYMLEVWGIPELEF